MSEHRGKIQGKAAFMNVPYPFLLHSTKCMAEQLGAIANYFFGIKF